MSQKNDQSNQGDALLANIINDFKKYGYYDLSNTTIGIDTAIGTSLGTVKKGQVVSVDGNMNVSIPYETAQDYDAISLAIKHILIEPLFFNDFYVAVYDENNNLLLDKKYFTKSLLSAKITAYEISKEDFCKDFPIYICTKNPIDHTINYQKIVLKYKNEDTPETND